MLAWPHRNRQQADIDTLVVTARDSCCRYQYFSPYVRCPGSLCHMSPDVRAALQTFVAWAVSAQRGDAWLSPTRYQGMGLLVCSLAELCLENWLQLLAKPEQALARTPDQARSRSGQEC